MHSSKQCKGNIFGSKNTKIQKFFKICSSGFSEILCDERYSKGSKSIVFKILAFHIFCFSASFFLISFLFQSQNQWSIVTLYLLIYWFDMCMFQFVLKNALFVTLKHTEMKYKQRLSFYNFCWSIEQKLLVECMFSQITFIIG